MQRSAHVANGPTLDACERLYQSLVEGAPTDPVSEWGRRGVWQDQRNYDDTSIGVSGALLEYMKAGLPSE